MITEISGGSTGRGNLSKLPFALLWARKSHLEPKTTSLLDSQFLHRYKLREKYGVTLKGGVKGHNNVHLNAVIKV